MASKPKQEYRQTEYRPPNVVKTGPHIPQVKYDETEINEYLNAVMEGDVLRVKKLLMETKLPYDVSDKKGSTVLHVILNKDPSKFSESWKLDIINSLPGLNTLVLKQDIRGVTPLHLMAMYQYVQIISQICPSNININVKDSNGLTPLHYAVIGYTTPCSNKRSEWKTGSTNIDPIDDTKIIETRYRKPPSIGKPELPLIDMNNRTSENMCIRTNPKTIQILIQRNISVNIADNQGLTPIYYALYHNNLEILEELMKITAISLPMSPFGTPYDYFKNNFMSFLDVFGGLSPTLSAINHFSDPFFQDFNELIKNEDNSYAEIFSKIPLQLINMIDDQFRLFVKEDVLVNANVIVNGETPYTSFWLEHDIDKVADYIKTHTISDNRNVFESKYIPIRNILAEPWYPKYYANWTKLTETYNSAIKHLFIELIMSETEEIIQNPSRNLTMRMIHDLTYLSDQLGNDINNYKFLTMDINDNYLFKYITQIIEHVLYISIIRKLYITLIAKIFEQLPATSPDKDLLSIKTNIHIADWGHQMVSEIVLNVFKTSGNQNTRDIIIKYLTNTSNIPTNISFATEFTKIASDFEPIIDSMINSSKKLIDGYINYWDNWILYTRVMIYILTHFK